MNTTQPAPGATTPTAAPSRMAWLLAGALGAASIGAGASLLVRTSAPAAPVAEARTAAPVAAAGLAAPVASPLAPAPAAAPASDKPAPAKAEPAATRAATGSAGTGTAVAKAETSPAAAPVCASCGTVESVHAVTRKGEASGVGAVAGGVLGAAVGNQMGKGDGRKAMTVLGALGGGLAGHEVEKRHKSTTVHQVRVRMDDGTLRTVEQAQAPRAGDRVRIEGGTLRHVNASTAPARG